MRVNLAFQELDVTVSDGVAGIIDAATDFIMDNLFPEFEEEDVFPDGVYRYVDFERERVTLECNPFWLKNPPTLH